MPSHAPRSSWRSTKLHLSLIAMGLMTLAYARAGFPPAQFGDYCMWITAAAASYSGAAAAEKFVKPAPGLPPAGLP